MDVLGFQPSITHDHIEGDFVPLIEGLESVSHNRSMVDENVLTGFLSNKAKPSLIIEPFYFATGHMHS